VARKLAVIMPALWSDGIFYVGDPAACAADTALRAHGKARYLLEIEARGELDRNRPIVTACLTAS
jgi:hypothetical protein